MRDISSSRFPVSLHLFFVSLLLPTRCWIWFLLSNQLWMFFHISFDFHIRLDPINLINLIQRSNREFQPEDNAFMSALDRHLFWSNSSKKWQVWLCIHGVICWFISYLDEWFMSYARKTSIQSIVAHIWSYWGLPCRTIDFQTEESPEKGQDVSISVLSLFTFSFSTLHLTMLAFFIFY